MFLSREIYLKLCQSYTKTYMRFGITLTQFCINFARQEHLALIGLDQLLKCLGFCLYPLSFISCFISTIVYILLYIYHIVYILLYIYHLFYILLHIYHLFYILLYIYHLSCFISTIYFISCFISTI